GCAGRDCSGGKPCNIARRIEAGAYFIDNAAVVDFGTDLAVQILPGDNSEFVVKLTRDQFDGAPIVVEMRLLAGYLQVTAAGEVAIDPFLANDLLHQVDGGEGSGIHTFCGFQSVAGNQSFNSKLHAGKDHAAVARTGAPAD